MLRPVLRCLTVRFAEPWFGGEFTVDMRILFLTALAVLLPVCRLGAVPADTLRVDSPYLGAVERVKHVVDRVLDIRDSYRKSRADTAYLMRTPGRLRLKLTLNAYGSDITTRGGEGGSGFESRLRAQNKYTTSVSASYRGLSLSVAFNPAKLAGRNKDYEFNLNAYGNRLGADVIFQSAKTYEGTVTADERQLDVPVGSVSQNMLTLNAYYVFSGRRFSFPAAFTQSWIQRRSHGSFMLGASFMGGRISTDYGDVLDTGSAKLGIACGALGVGYAYNWVIKERWLLHISTLPQLVVLNRCRLTTAAGKEKMPYRFPNAIAVGRLAVVRHFGKYFAGLNAVVNTLHIGDRDELSLGSTKWRAKLFVGIIL